MCVYVHMYSQFWRRYASSISTQSYPRFRSNLSGYQLRTHLIHIQLTSPSTYYYICVCVCFLVSAAGQRSSKQISDPLRELHLGEVSFIDTYCYVLGASSEFFWQRRNEKRLEKNPYEVCTRTHYLAYFWNHPNIKRKPFRYQSGDVWNVLAEQNSLTYNILRVHTSK